MGMFPLDRRGEQLGVGRGQNNGRVDTELLEDLEENIERFVGPRPSFERTLVVFDHFWDFDRLVEDGAPRQS
jgi:hypothetical protein